MIPETPLKANGKEYSLRFSARTIINIEKAMGKPIATLSTIDESSVSIDLFNIFFTESIRDIEGKKLQPSEIEEILDSITITEMTDAVQAGFNTAFPEEKKKEGGKGN